MQMELGATARLPVLGPENERDGDRVFLSTAAARPSDYRLALFVVALSVLGFVGTVWFVRVGWPRIPAFVPAYESALAINDLITAVLLFGQFLNRRQRAILVLAAAYLFDALLIIPHALTFPGVFSPTGLLDAGTQTTAWLYVFWHAGFAALVLVYALLGADDTVKGDPVHAVRNTVLFVAAMALILTVVATAGEQALPVIVVNGDYSLLVSKGVSPAILALCLAALVVLWRKKTPTVLDLWIMLVMSAWLFDVSLSAVLGSSRFDLGWYVGRLYGLFAAAFVLIVLLVETGSLQRELATANNALSRLAESLSDRVRARTHDLAETNETLRREMAERKATETQLVQAQKMEAIGNLTGGMAHDFNNLLGVIIGNLDQMKDETNAETAELVQEALDAALMGADLTKRLLAFARRQPLQPRLIDVNEHVGGISKLLARTLGEHVTVSLDLARDTWSVRVDPAQLDSSLTNLATNARDAMGKGGKLTIRTGNRTLDEDYASQHAELAPGDYALIEVSDSGSGMTPETQQRIFEPFFTTKEKGKGTGLGLAMVFGFMKQSGGHINVYSEVGIGTTFRLYLPRVREAVQSTEAKDAKATARGHAETVLVVEDNEKLRRVAVRQLGDLGYRVIETDGPKPALALLEQQRVDLLFSDIVMPGGMTGIALAEAVRERWSGVKVILTSGYPDMELPRGAESIRLLTKPYRKDELARLVREVLEK